MRTYAFDLATAQAIAFLYTITRRDGTVIRITSWPLSIYISGHIWVPDPGLKLSDISEKNDGTPAASQIQFGVSSDGLITPQDLADRQYEGATVLIQVCDPFNPTTPDFHQYFRVGGVSKPLYGVVTCGLQNPHGLARISFVPKATAECRFPFGGIMCGMPIMRPDIVRSTPYLASPGSGIPGDTARFNNGTSPTGYGNRYFECTTAGTTSSSAPTFDYTIGHTTTDGSVVWTARNAWERAFVIGTVVDRHNLTLAASVDARDADGWFGPGKLMFTSGRDTNRIYRVAAWRQSDLQLTTFIPCGLRVAAGDVGFIWPDCNKTPDHCLNKFDNRRRYGGFDKYLGAKSATQVF